jgi:hypothetical protein
VQACELHEGEEVLDVVSPSCDGLRKVWIQAKSRPAFQRFFIPSMKLSAVRLQQDVQAL